MTHRSMSAYSVGSFRASRYAPQQVDLLVVEYLMFSAGKLPCFTVV